MVSNSRAEKWVREVHTHRSGCREPGSGFVTDRHWYSKWGMQWMDRCSHWDDTHTPCLPSLAEATWVTVPERMQEWRRCIFYLSTGTAASTSPWVYHLHRPLSISIFFPYIPAAPLYPLSLSLPPLSPPIWTSTDDRSRVLFFSGRVFLPCSDTEGPILV